MTRYFLLGSAPNTEFYDGECAIGVVAIDDELLTLIRRRRAAFRLAATADKDLHNMDFWDCRVRFFDSNELDADLLLDGIEDKNLVELFNDNQFVEIDEELYDRICKEFEEARTELDTMCVYSEGVYWRASPKDVSLAVETTTLTFDILFREKPDDSTG